MTFNTQNCAFSFNSKDCDQYKEKKITFLTQKAGHYGRPGHCENID